MRMRRWRLVLAALWISGAAHAQDQTLADIRQELNAVYVELQALKRELSTTGSPQVNTGAGSLLDRVTTIESELTRLTAKTEELEYRIERIVQDGTLRIGDLEFRLVELEGGDVSQLGTTTTLGGDVPSSAPAPAPGPASGDTGGAQLAANEQGDFERASEALAQGDFRGAADQFAAFNETYPAGPLAVAADLRRGEALESLGDTREAARAYLQAFRFDQDGPLASEALFLLGRSLGKLGQSTEACVTLGEVGARFPGAEAAARASEEMRQLGCE